MTVSESPSISYDSDLSSSSSFDNMRFFEAVFVGFLSSVSLMMGSVIGLRWPPGHSESGMLAAFGGGALIAALAVELIAPVAEKVISIHTPEDEKDEKKVLLAVTLVASVVGGFCFVLLDQLVSRSGGFVRSYYTAMVFYAKKKQKKGQMLGALSESPVFATVALDELKLLCTFCKPEYFAPGTEIFKRGAQVTKMYFLETGKVEIVRAGEGMSVFVEKGGIIGEVSLLSGTEMSIGTHIARGQVRALSITKTAALSLLESCPSLSQAVHAFCLQKLEQVVISENNNLTRGVKQTRDTIGKIRSWENVKSLSKQAEENGEEHEMENGEMDHADGSALGGPVTVVVNGGDADHVNRMQSGDEDSGGGVRMNGGILRKSSDAQSTHSIVHLNEEAQKLLPETSVGEHEEMNPLSRTSAADESQSMRRSASAHDNSYQGGEQQVDEDEDRFENRIARRHTMTMSGEVAQEYQAELTRIRKTVERNSMALMHISRPNSAIPKEDFEGLIMTRSTAGNRGNSAQSNRRGSNGNNNSVHAWGDHSAPGSPSGSLVGAVSPADVIKKLFRQGSHHDDDDSYTPKAQRSAFSKKVKFDSNANDLSSSQVDISIFDANELDVDIESYPSQDKLAEEGSVNGSVIGSVRGGKKLNRNNTMRISDTLAGKSDVAPLAVWLGILLDGVPESFVIGLHYANDIHTHKTQGLASGLFDLIPYTLIAGLFLSNFPEALSSSLSMYKYGWSEMRVFLMWTSLTVITSLGAGCGYALENELSEMMVHAVQGLAAGAMLTMIASAMIPEALHTCGSVRTGLSTLMGFVVAVAFKLLE